MIFQYLAWPFAAAKVHNIFHMAKNYNEKKKEYPFLIMNLANRMDIFVK